MGWVTEAREKLGEMLSGLPHNLLALARATAVDALCEGLALIPPMASPRPKAMSALPLASTISVPHRCAVHASVVQMRT